MQEADVWAAADALIAQGLRPTIERVRQHIGRGSPNTVSPMLETWFAALGQRLGVAESGNELVDQVPEPVRQAAEQMWNSALEQAKMAAEQVLQTRETQISVAEESMKAQQQQLGQREEVMQQQRSAMDEAMKLANSQAQELSRRLEEMQQLLQEREAQIQSLRNELLEKDANVKRINSSMLKLCRQPLQSVNDWRSNSPATNDACWASSTALARKSAQPKAGRRDRASSAGPL